MGWAIYIANGALIALSCFLVANIANQWTAEVIAPPVEPPKAIVADRDGGPARTVSHDVILSRNLFKSDVADTLIAAPVVEDEPTEDTNLPLKLLGTAAASDDTRSTAALEITSTRKTQVVKVGDELEGLADVRVAGIERKRIILDNKGRREQLVLEEDVAANVLRPPIPAPARPTARSRREDRTSALADRLREMQGDKDDDKRSPSALFSQGRILPEYENGEMVGIKIDKIQPGGFYDQIGLSDGDVVTSINGIDIDSPSATKDVLRALTEEETLTVTTLKGQELTVDAKTALESME